MEFKNKHCGYTNEYHIIFHILFLWVSSGQRYSKPTQSKYKKTKFHQWKITPAYPALNLPSPSFLSVSTREKTHHKKKYQIITFIY